MIIIRAMDPYELLWMVLLIVFVLGELATIGLTCIWFAAGALAALVMAMAGINPVVQFLVFFVVSILLLAATRPWARKYVNAKMQRTNAQEKEYKTKLWKQKFIKTKKHKIYGFPSASVIWIRPGWQLFMDRSGRCVPVMIMRSLNREKKQKFWQSVVSNL